jgi:hypothetical protein
MENLREPVHVKMSYPYSEEYDYITRLSTIDLDSECQRDIESGNGFLISSPKQTIKKDVKNPNGIYSQKFGRKIGDANPYADRYSCECGELKSHINRGIICKKCGTVCKFVDDNFKMFGWIQLKEKYHIIHPKFYDTLDYIFGQSPFNEERKKIKGSRLKNILNYSPEVDQHGFRSECTFKPDKEPFYGIGMMEFYERFDEILDYYIKLFPKKIEYYNEIQDYRYTCNCKDYRTKMYGKEYAGKICPHCNGMIHFVDKDVIFTHSIPVFTTHLRPADITSDGFMYFEPINGMYNMINKHVHLINKDRRKYDQDIKIKNAELFKTQMQYMDLVGEIYNIITGKKGTLRMLIGGRYNFSCRAVIRQSAELRIDQVLLPYVELVKCLQQQIINILIRTYNISPSDAYDIWSRAVATKDERVCQILNSLIHANPEGLPILLNRNPTLNYGSILQMFCVGFTDTLTMSVPLQVLKLLGADQKAIKVPFYSDIDRINCFKLLGDYNALIATA